MSPIADKVLADALKLSERERADLAARLLDSLDPAAEAEREALWDAEIERRVAELDAGTAKTISLEEVQEKARVIIRDASR